MVAFDRSKFQAGKITDVDNTIKKAQKTMFQNNGGNWVQFLTPEDGKNIVRVLPSLKGSPYVPLKTAKLPCEVDIKDKEGNVVGREIKDKNIYCADVHGADSLKGKDPILTYIKYVRALAEDIQDKEERDRFLFPVTGGPTKKGWVWGIEPMLGFICYVTEDGSDILKLQLRPQWMKEMKNISVRQSEDETLSLDIFSDPDNGYPLCIDKYKDEKKKTKFDITAVLPKKTQNWDDFFEENRVPDAILQKLADLPSLEENYVNVYKKKDWDLALEGLQRFDETQGYNVFGLEEFINELEEMAELVPEDTKKEVDEESHEEEKKPVASDKGRSFVKKAVEEARTEEIKRPAATGKAQTISKYPPLIQLKSALRTYIKEVYGDEVDLPSTLSIVELRDWYDLMQQEKELPLEDYIDGGDNLPFDSAFSEQESGQASEQAEEPVEEAKTNVATPTLSEARSRLAAIRPKR